MHRPIFFILLLAGWLTACQHTEVTPYPALQWSRAADFPDGPRSSATVCTTGGKAYLFFGRKGFHDRYQRDCWEYDAGSDRWTRRADCPGAGRVNPVSVAANGRIYTGLGYTDTTFIKVPEHLYLDTLYLKDFWSYDPLTDRWQEETRAPFKGTDACVAFAREGEVYVGLGYYSSTFSSEWWKYCPDTRLWIRMNRFGGIGRVGALLASDGERTFAGTGFCVYNLNDWWEYRPASDTWRKCREIPDDGRLNGTALTVGGRWFATTGRQFNGSLTGGHVKASVLEYDPERDTWYDAGRLPASGRENAVAFTLGDRGYVGLGENDERLLSDLWYFTVK